MPIRHLLAQSIFVESWALKDGINTNEFPVRQMKFSFTSLKLIIRLVPKFDLRMWSTTTTLEAIIISYIIYAIGVAIHRLYFSQYAKFPGPKLAALTYGYMFYYDAIIGEGQYMYKIKALHEEYGELSLPSSPPRSQVPLHLFIH